MKAWEKNSSAREINLINRLPLCVGFMTLMVLNAGAESRNQDASVRPPMNYPASTRPYEGDSEPSSGPQDDDITSTPASRFPRRNKKIEACDDSRRHSKRAIIGYLQKISPKLFKVRDKKEERKEKALKKVLPKTKLREDKEDAERESMLRVLAAFECSEVEFFKAVEKCRPKKGESKPDTECYQKQAKRIWRETLELYQVTK
mgnify:CR=1 FL=1